MKRGLKLSSTLDRLDWQFRRARLPDEEGTETRDSAAGSTRATGRPAAPRGGGTGNNMRARSMHRPTAARGSPMKRGLKHMTTVERMVSVLSRARLPDEEGTETRDPRAGRTRATGRARLPDEEGTETKKSPDQ